MNGNYQVGVRTYHIPKPGYNGCLVYYPMDTKDFVEQIEKKNMMWMTDDFENESTMIQIMCRSFLPDWIGCYSSFSDEGRNFSSLIKQSKKIGRALFGVLRICQVDCVFEGKLHGDFSSGKKAIRPLVFSHGLSG